MKVRHPHRFARAAVAVALGVALGLALATGAGAGALSPDARAQEPPTNVEPPSVRGELRVGGILRADPGTWRPRSKQTTLSFQWQRCNAAGQECAGIRGATDRIYPLRIDDASRRLRVVVTASTKEGDSSLASATTAAVGAAPQDAPVNTVRPTISGKAQRGEVLVAQAGTWTGEDEIRVRYRWRRCEVSLGPCDYVERSGKTYALGRADVGRAVRVLVVARNEAGESAALSEATGEILGPSAAAKPVNTSPPLVTGTARQGETLTASSGSWAGAVPITFAFRWQRCGDSGRRCSTIAGATAQAYTVGPRDVGRTLRIRVIATNEAGRGSAISDQTPVVAGLRAPVNTASPSVSGTARAGAVLTAATGSWTGAVPIRFAFRWLRCNAGGDRCAEIRGATGQTRALTSNDVGHTLRVRVTASNAAGKSSALSSPSALVAPGGDAPANTSRPTLSGDAVQGTRLTLSIGGWTGTPTITFSFQWKRCTASLSSCTLVAGATGNTYVVTRADVAHRLVGVVIARNNIGSSRAESNATPVIIGAPVNSSPPTIVGRTTQGEILTATTGGWTGPGPITFGYQWTRCDATGAFTSCVPIVVTASRSYTLVAADVGHRIFVQVKAQNRFGASFVNSAQTPVVAPAPPGTLTIRLARQVVTYGTRVTLSGVLVNGRPGQPVTIVERRAGARPLVHANVAAISVTGAWRYLARPLASTSYSAQVGGRTSTLVVVQVRPRLRLARTRAGQVSVRVFAARSFGGKRALLQRWHPGQRRWVTVRRVRLRPTRLGIRPTVVTAATIRAPALRGKLVRVVLPSRQAGPGYLQGVSNRVRG